MRFNPTWRFLCWSSMTLLMYWPSFEGPTCTPLCPAASDVSFFLHYTKHYLLISFSPIQAMNFSPKGPHKRTTSSRWNIHRSQKAENFCSKCPSHFSTGSISTPASHLHCKFLEAETCLFILCHQHCRCLHANHIKSQGTLQGGDLNLLTSVSPSMFGTGWLTEQTSSKCQTALIWWGERDLCQIWSRKAAAV